MKKILINKIYILFFFLIFALFFQKDALAATLTLSLNKDKVGIEEEFYLDVLLDPEGVSINGVEGSISFSKEELSLSRIEEGKSMIGLWIEKPKLDTNNQIKFSGIIPNGFDGLIDPFNTKHKLPGPILRLVFKGINQSEALIQLSPSLVTLNDGLGTIEYINSNQAIVTIKSVFKPEMYQNKNDIHPEIEFEIVQDQNLFDNAFTLIFKISDKETGIKEVLIKEGKRPWKAIESPYQLADQNRQSQISLMAVNFSGASIIKTIEPLPYQLFSFLNISLVLIIFILIIFFIKKNLK
jgi:hypothetical protein